MNIGVLVSHAGSTLQSVLDACASGRISGRVALVISNNGGSGALTRAREAGVSGLHLSSHTHPTPEALDIAMRDALIGARVDLVLLAGYMKRLGPNVLAAFGGRILNTHPALLPKFGGTGMYGDRVFEAVLRSGDTETGVSIHQVDPDYDSGAIVGQCRVPVLPYDSVEDLKKRVQDREKQFVVETIGAIASDRRRVAATAG